MSEITIHILHCGEVGVDPAVPDRSVSKNPLAFTGLFRSTQRRIWIPVRTYLIEAPKGTVLVDTSWNSEVRTHPVHTVTPALYFASKPRLPAGEAVDEQIAKLGYKTTDIDYVILTHMDVDHANGLPLVKNAKHIMASSDELEESRTHDVRYNSRQWKGIAIQPVPFTHESGAGPENKSWDVFGDGTVIAVLTPGHAKGSLCVLVRNPQTGSFVLIAGDTGYKPDSWKKGLLPGPVYDKKKMSASLAWVKKLSEKNECHGVFACHDPQQQEEKVTL